MSFSNHQSQSRFQNAPQVNFFLQPSLLSLPCIQEASRIESKPILKAWNMVVLGLMISSAFGLYAHASLGDRGVDTLNDKTVGNIPSFETVLLNEPKDKAQPLKPLTDTVSAQQLALMDQQTKATPRPNEGVVDDDEVLLNKVLSKPKVTVGLPHIRARFSPLKSRIFETPEFKTHEHEFKTHEHEVESPAEQPAASRYGQHFTLETDNSFHFPLRRLNISSRFGFRHGRMHTGVDLAAPTGTDILATRAGVVAYSGWEGGYGYTIILDHGHGVQTRYAHCSRLLVREGQRIAQGNRIALVGSTGHSTGCHLHFEVIDQGIAKNPEKYLFR